MTVDQTLGETFDPLGAHLQDPYPFYARARDEEPVFWSPVVNAWVLTRYADVRAVLRNPDDYSSAGVLRPLTPLPPSTAAVMRQGYPYDPPSWNQDGEGHRRLRAPVARVLSGARVAAAEPFIRRRVEELVDALVGDGHAELMGQLADQLPISVIAHLCELTPEDAKVAFDGSLKGNQVLFDQLPEPERTEAAHASVAFQRMCGRYVKSRRAQPGDDLISQVVTSLAPDDEPLTFEQETQLARLVFILVLAGHVTTSALIGAAVRHLLADQNRWQWELLRERPELIGQAVEEAARYDTPSHAFLRTTTREVTLGGRRLPEGTDVLVVFAAANRDPELCERPETFDITRAPVRHVAFGAGPHACVGATLGRRQAEITLETLTRRLPGMRLAPGQDFRIQGTLMIRGLTALHVTW